MRPLLSIIFPKYFESLKSLEIGLWEMNAKKDLNGVNKV